MFCTKCGNVITKQTDFCKSCGHRVRHRTPSIPGNVNVGQQARQTIQSPSSGQQIMSGISQAVSNLKRSTENTIAQSRFSHKQIAASGIGLVVIIVLAALLFSGPSLIGTWEQEQGPRIVNTIEFRRGGTGVADGEPFTWNRSGNRLTITFSSWGVTISENFSIVDSSRSQITVRNADDRILIFRRQ